MGRIIDETNSRGTIHHSDGSNACNLPLDSGDYLSAVTAEHTNDMSVQLVSLKLADRFYVYYHMNIRLLSEYLKGLEGGIPPLMLLSFTYFTYTYCLNVHGNSTPSARMLLAELLHTLLLSI